MTRPPSWPRTKKRTELPSSLPEGPRQGPFDFLASSLTRRTHAFSWTYGQPILIGMSQLWVDPFSGLSGDLWVAAFAALGVPEADLRATLRKLPFEDLELRLEPAMRCGLEGLRAKVVIGGRV